jgi:hypothetical protein
VTSGWNAAGGVVGGGSEKVMITDGGSETGAAVRTVVALHSSRTGAAA